MKNQEISQRVSNFVRLVRAVIAQVILPTPPRGLTPVPVSVQRQSSPTRWLAFSRRTGWLPLLVGFVLLAAVPVWGGAPALPAGVPNIFDPAVQAHFQLVAVATLQENPDLPVVLLVNITGDGPRVLLLGFDARNGTDTWSLTTDPIILIVVFSDATKVQGAYVDVGFADRGKASGTYATVDTANASSLSELLKAIPTMGKQSKT